MKKKENRENSVLLGFLYKVGDKYHAVVVSSFHHLQQRGENTYVAASEENHPRVPLRWPLQAAWLNILSTN